MKNKTAYFGVFTSLALILSYVETLIPISFGIPGIKLGLANLVIVIVLYTYGEKEAFLLSPETFFDVHLVDIKIV